MSSEKIEENIFENIFNKIKRYPRIVSFFIIILIIFFASFFLINERDKKSNIFASNQFNKAKIMIANNQTEEATLILKNIINKKNKFYSPLSLYLILEKNLVIEQEKILELFNIVLANRKIDEESVNLILIKKGLFFGNFNDEKSMLNTLNPIVNSDSVWRPEAIKILGDYFFYKGEKRKSEEYYNLLKVN